MKALRRLLLSQRKKNACNQRFNSTANVTCDGFETTAAIEPAIDSEKFNKICFYLSTLLADYEIGGSTEPSHVRHFTDEHTEEGPRSRIIIRSAQVEKTGIVLAALMHEILGDDAQVTLHGMPVEVDVYDNATTQQNHNLSPCNATSPRTAELMASSVA